MSHPFQTSTIERLLVLRARHDVQLAPVHFSGQIAYVLKDPLSLELFHLTAEELFLFERLKQSISLKELQQAFEERFAPRRIKLHELQHGINQLHSQGLLVSEAAGQADELLDRAQRRQKNERWQSLLKLLSFRLGSIDATAIIDGLHKRVQWVFSLPMRITLLATFIYAIAVLIGQSSELVAHLPSLVELSQPRYWLLWIATIVAVKIMHELAHAVTCKHFGGRCHEIGVLLLAFFPCLYCDVTDVWRLSNKWQRIVVSAAGIVAELTIAALALIAWHHAQPGLFQTWCLSLVMICSVNTVLVNANPLLRYDGYYVLSDFVEVPNLAGRAQGLMPATLRRWLLAEPRTSDPLLSTRQIKGLWIYALTARIYLTFVLLGIFVVLLTWAKPYRLENLIYTLGVITMAGMFVQPLVGVWRMLKNPASRYRMRRGRLAGLAFVALGLALAFFYWPIPRSISGPVVLVPATGKPVYATIAGELRFTLPAGSSVQPGDTLARLVNSQSQLAVAQQQGEYEVRQVRYQQLGTMRTWDKDSAQKLPTARAAMNDAAAQLEELQQKAAELTITAPAAGVVLAPPRTDRREDDSNRLSVWSGSPTEPENLGSWIEPGTLLCMVANPERLDVLVAIDQSDAPEVQEGQTVRILLESSPGCVLTGQVVQIARRSAERETVDNAIDTGKYHLAQVQLDTPGTSLLVGMRGKAKIEAQRNTLSTIVANQLRQLIRLPW